MRHALCLTARQYGEVVLVWECRLWTQIFHRGRVTLHSRNEQTMAHFLPSRYKFYELYECRGTRLIGAANLSPATNLVAGTGAVSRYNLSRRQKFVKVQDLNYRQMRVSGCKNHYESVLGAGARAKSVTNNLPILSVLAFRYVVICYEPVQSSL